MAKRIKELKTSYRVFIPKEGYKIFRISKKFAKMLEETTNEHEDVLKDLAKL